MKTTLRSNEIPTRNACIAKGLFWRFLFPLLLPLLSILAWLGLDQCFKPRRRSLSYDTVLSTSSWPLFRMLELLRLRTVAAISQGSAWALFATSPAHGPALSR
eukprot:36508-Amphidinium_carterae.1